jgi:hypothetical protein
VASENGYDARYPAWVSMGTEGQYWDCKAKWLLKPEKEKQ